MDITSIPEILLCIIFVSVVYASEVNYLQSLLDPMESRNLPIVPKKEGIDLLFSKFNSSPEKSVEKYSRSNTNNDCNSISENSNENSIRNCGWKGNNKDLPKFTMEDIIKDSKRFFSDNQEELDDPQFVQSRTNLDNLKTHNNYFNKDNMVNNIVKPITSEFYSNQPSQRYFTKKNGSSFNRNFSKNSNGFSYQMQYIPFSKNSSIEQEPKLPQSRLYLDLNPGFKTLPYYSYPSLQNLLQGFYFSPESFWKTGPIEQESTLPKSRLFLPSAPNYKTLHYVSPPSVLNYPRRNYFTPVSLLKTVPLKKETKLSKSSFTFQ